MPPLGQCYLVSGCPVLGLVAGDDTACPNLDVVEHDQPASARQAIELVRPTRPSGPTGRQRSTSQPRLSTDPPQGSGRPPSPWPVARRTSPSWPHDCTSSVGAVVDGNLLEQFAGRIWVLAAQMLKHSSSALRHQPVTKMRTSTRI